MSQDHHNKSIADVSGSINVLQLVAVEVNPVYGRWLRFKAVSGPSNAGRPNDGVVCFTEERESRVTATSLGFVKGGAARDSPCPREAAIRQRPALSALTVPHYAPAEGYSLILIHSHYVFTEDYSRAAIQHPPLSA